MRLLGTAAIVALLTTDVWSSLVVERSNIPDCVPLFNDNPFGRGWDVCDKYLSSFFNETA
jgi:hypothetical protein